MELEPDGIAPPADDPQAGGSKVVQQIEVLLDEEQFEAALEAIDSALERGEGNVLDLTYLAGDAW
ncbi:MAG: hypothetical protein KDE27_13420, partial [Planctomycetes bacterium]|nr:hypothetical protein [Planctomycetota bacterium]